MFILVDNNGITLASRTKGFLLLNYMQWYFIVQTILEKCPCHFMDAWNNFIILCFWNDKVNRDTVRASPSLF